MKAPSNSTIVDDAHFEREVRRLAALIWPTGRVDRSPIIDGRERDAVVETPDMITVIEATTSRKLEKIKDDSKKTHELVKKIRSQGFTARGIIVTLNEPTPEQEEEIKKYRSSVQIWSYDQLILRLFDSSEYLQNRLSRPFGSIQDPKNNHHSLGREYYIPVKLLEGVSDKEISVSDMGRGVIEDSARFAVIADFGSGKSMCLRELFYLLRDSFIKKSHNRFPVYINLRDHAGAKYPSEILERHARDLGMRDTTQLVKAWRLTIHQFLSPHLTARIGV